MKIFKIIELPKFKIEKNEYVINKQRLCKFAGIGLSSVVGYLLYTKTGFDDFFENILFSIPILKDLLQFTLVKVFLISIVLYYIKNIID